VERIASRAKIRKQLLFHYFPSKEQLFRIVLEDTFQRREKWDLQPATPRRILRHRFEFAVSDRLWLRFLMWEAAAYKPGRAIRWEGRRRQALAGQRATLRAFQRREKFAPWAATACMQLALYALANYPELYPQITRLVTGHEAGSVKFRRQWGKFLEQLAAALIAPGGKGARA
jgi:AcrR family transcriptional regulator